MSYDEDIDGESSTRRKPTNKRQRGLGRSGDRREREATVNDMIQHTLAAVASRRPGQIFPVNPGNNGLHDEETITEALWQAAGKLSIASGWLGILRSNLENRIANSEALQEVMYEIKELDLDNTELQLDMLAAAGCDKAVIFKLKQMGKMRGWGEAKITADPNRLTLDAARELDSKLHSAFSQIREAAIDAVVATTQVAATPAIESKPAVTIDVAPVTVDEELNADAKLT